MKRPDLALLGYLLNALAGAAAYNATRSYAGPALPLAVIWAAHIGFDRVLEYGLTSRAGFRYTHRGIVGQARA